jgi:hypothetical protein
VPVAVGRKVTLIVQLAFTDSVEPHVVVRAKSPELVPAIVIPVMDIVALPVFRNVIVLAALVVFNCCAANVNVVGETLAVELTPVPAKATCCGLVGSESAIRRVADRDPDAEGENVTLIVQLEPAASVVPQVVVSLKSAALVPVSEMEIPVNDVVPILLTVTTLAALVVPTFWLLNERLVGDRLTPVPVPVSDITWGFPGALSAIEMAALLEPEEVGRKLAVMVQLLPAARVELHVLVCEKSEALVPDKLIPPILIVTFPLFLRVTVCEELVVFTV